MNSEKLRRLLVQYEECWISSLSLFGPGAQGKGVDHQYGHDSIFHSGGALLTAGERWCSASGFIPTFCWDFSPCEWLFCLLHSPRSNKWCFPLVLIVKDLILIQSWHQKTQAEDDLPSGGLWRYLHNMLMLFAFYTCWLIVSAYNFCNSEASASLSCSFTLSY